MTFLFHISSHWRRASDVISWASLHFMQPIRFLLYCLSAVTGVVGLVVGGGPVVDYAWRRLFGMSYSVQWDQLFRSTVAFFLSLILLILVHLGHRLAGAFVIGLPKKQDADDLQKKSEV